MAFSCRYAASGKKAGRPKRGFPLVTASHRSAIALRKAVDSVRGKVPVCGRAPAPGATGREAGDGGALACGTALPAGLAGVVGCDVTPVPGALAWVADGGGAGEDGAGEPAPHPASRAAVMSAVASGGRRDNIIPSPRHVAFSFRVQPRLLHLPPGMSVGQGNMERWQQSHPRPGTR